MVLDKLPVPERPTNLDYSMAWAYCACSRYSGGCLDIFSLASFSLSLGDGPIYTEILSQRAVKPKTTNQPTEYIENKSNHRLSSFSLGINSF